MTQSPLLLPRLFKLVGAALLLAGLTAPSGCSSEEQCAGTEIDGVCYATCSDAACVEGNRCIPDPTSSIVSCRPPCGTQDDCELGTNCVGATFGDGTSGQFCVAMLGGETGQGNSCTDANQCDRRRGFDCVAGTCSKPCATAKDCAEGELCGDQGDGTSVCTPGPCDCDFGGGQRCVNLGGTNQCTTPCKGHGDCSSGELCRTGVVTLDGGDTVNACKPGPCSSNSDCNVQPGFHCIDAECVQAECLEHRNCPGELCTTGGQDVDGNTVNYCAAAPGEKRGPGEYGSSCPGGAADCATGFRCLGQGEGDLYSYCTEFDCTQDTDCGTGFHCARVRVGDAQCADTCPGIETGGAPCAAAANIGPGKQYECGAVSLMRNACIKNEFCAPCERDEDCLGEAGQVCAKGPDGVKTCTVPCDISVDSCPWGNAAECKVFDTDKGYATCGHRFGSCQGTGAGCEPCVDDDQCGAQGLCVGSSFTGEKFCVDLATECSCDGLSEALPGACVGGGCPTSPNGLSMYCFGKLTDPTNLLYNRCYGANANPNPLSSPQLGCWRP